MKKKEKNRIKSFVVVIATICISTFYVLGPLHQQIADWAHTLSHKLETSHNNTFEKSEGHSHNDHSFNHDENDFREHKHGLIAIFDSFFKNFNNDKPADETILTHFKIDKHIIINSLAINCTNIKKNSSEINSLTSQKIKKGHVQKMIVPPKEISGS